MEEITSAELFKVIGKNVKYYRKLYKSIGYGLT